MLQYPDGSSRPRPPLFHLARVQPRLAVRCAWDELPGWSRPYDAMSRIRPVPATQRVLWSLLATLATLLPLAGGAAGVFNGSAWLADSKNITVPAGAVVALAAWQAFTGLSATVTFLVSRWRRRGARGAWRTFGPPDARSCGLLSVLYGPALLAATACALGVGAAVAGAWFIQWMFRR